MNSNWITVEDRSATPPLLADLRVTVWDAYTDAAAVPAVLTEADGLVIETAPAAVRLALEVPDEDYLFRLRGLPQYVPEHKAVVQLLAPPDPEVVLSEFSFGGEPLQTRTLYELFEPAAGSVPVVITVADLEGDPVIGVDFSIWSTDLLTPVVPLIRSDSGGVARCALPPGPYKVFGFKPFHSFVPHLPYDLTVGSSLTTLAVEVSSDAPALPTVPKVTVYGYVLDAEVRPMAGVEVKARVLNTPQRLAGGAFSLRGDLVKLTDATGRFEFYLAAGCQIALACEAVGYARKGRVPLLGSINWEELGKEVAE